MREIKFRAYDDLIKKMIYGVESPREDSYVCNKEKVIFHIMQYTGLKDNNGVEVYEGDIISKKEYDYGDEGEAIEIGEKRYKIVYNTHFLGFIGSQHGEPLREFNGIEVIGNIYENPELLEDNK